ncbi:MAG: hypothetical protein ABIH23_25705 [bacterium]
MPHEFLLMDWVSKEASLEAIEGATSTYWLGKLWVSSRYPQSVTPAFGAHYGRHRWSIRADAPTTVGFPGIEVGEDAFLRFGWYMSSGAYERGSDGASFRVWCATQPAQDAVCIFQATETIDRTATPTGPRFETITLPTRAGGRGAFVF